MIYLALILAAVTLVWQDNSDNEAGFSVERAVDCSQFEEIGMTGTGVAMFFDPVPIDKACYRVRAFNENGFSGYSNTAQYLAPVTPPPPCEMKGKSGKCH